MRDLDEAELVQAIDELVDVVEVLCSCGDAGHTRHLVLLRGVRDED